MRRVREGDLRRMEDTAVQRRGGPKVCSLFSQLCLGSFVLRFLFPVHGDLFRLATVVRIRCMLVIESLGDGLDLEVSYISQSCIEVSLRRVKFSL